MPTIKYPKNPNIDTAFIEQDDGTKNRALMVAPQDISTLELPNNPNSTKGYVTINGKKQRVVLTADISGNSGGDQHNLGWYSTPEALEEAHATAEAGDWAIVGSTDTVWIWDTDTSAWKDSDTKGQVTSVNNQTGAVTITDTDILPSQTGQSGKFLTTDGTDASWSDKPLVNTATGSYSVTVGSSWGASSTKATSVGYGSDASGDFSTAIGFESYITNGNSHALCIGAQSYVDAIGAMQFGKGNNSEAGTVYYSLTTDGTTFTNYKLLDSDGTIPHTRLTNALSSTTVTIAVADWNGGTTCSKTVSGLTATSVVFVAPDNASQSDYLDAGVYASSQTTDTLTFTCTTTPTSALTVTVVYCQKGVKDVYYKSNC